MSTKKGVIARKGPPKHQNTFAWKPDGGKKKNETEPGGRFRPLAEISGVCGRCKDQIEWKRKYGKYKLLVEPAKCNQCGNRAVRQAYHTLCSACAKQRGVCAKCARVVESIIGRDAEEVESERKQLEEAIKHARERDRRTLLRNMNTKAAGNGGSILKKGLNDSKADSPMPNEEELQSDDEDDESPGVE